MEKECEFCGNTEEPWSLDGGYSEQYTFCLNCHVALVTLSLSPEQFLRAKAKGGDTNRFYLHDDFYDPETGIAQQSMFQ